MGLLLRNNRIHIAEKLKARKVVQWSIAYFAIAWGALEVLDFLVVQFGWPRFIVRSSVVVLGTGFFVVLTIAWHHGDKGRQRVGGLELITLALIIVLGGALTVFVNLPPGDSGRRFAPAGPVNRLTITLPREQRLSIKGGGAFSLAVSPDGQRVAYIAETADGNRLVVRPFDSFDATVFDGTDHAEQPFFSPDGQWIGFFARGELRKVPISGGAPITISQIHGAGSGASWGPDDMILYSLGSRGLWIVPAAGGEPHEIVTTRQAASSSEHLDPAVMSRGPTLEWPSILPDGEHALVTDGARVVALSIATGELTELIVAAGRQARYLDPGFLVFTETGELVRAVSFDLNRLQVTGQPFPVIENVFRSPGGGAVHFDVSRTGTLVYVTGGFERTLMLADREGRLEPLTRDKRGFRWPRFSPEGDRVVVTVDPRPSEIWIYDVARGLGRKISGDGHNVMPIWPNNHNGIIYAGDQTLRRLDPDRPGESSIVFPAEGRLEASFYPTSATSDGRHIAGNRWAHGRGIDVYLIDTSGEGSIRPFRNTPENELNPDISPDGKWISYASDETGRVEVYVQSLSDAGVRERISDHGGDDPSWSADGSEIFYRWGITIMSAEVTTKPSLRSSASTVVFRAELDTTQLRNWDVGPDNQFVIVASDPSTTRELQVVLNWTRAVEELAP